MLKISKTLVTNLEGALRGMRNPFSSWEKSDSHYDADGQYILGPADIDLARRLCTSGSDHRKFIRQIIVSVDFDGPLYWWKEYDTYKVATVANSTSTMHCIHKKPFSREDFSCEKLTPDSLQVLDTLIAQLEKLRSEFLQTKDKTAWYNMIQLLPSSYNQLRTCTLNYETLTNIYYARKNHKLDEWHTLCRWIESLPYADVLILKPEKTDG